jgi:hypothetical protein
MEGADAFIEEAEEEGAGGFKVSEKVPKPLVQFIKNSRFIKMLHSDYSDRPPKTLEWMIHTLRSIYDEKTVDDRTNVRDQIPVSKLPEYILVWGFRQFGRDELIEQGCWDIFITAHYFMQRVIEVGQFVQFLDENLLVEQLTLFLQYRAWILQRCVSIPVDHPDLEVYYTEIYLTAPQVGEFFHANFPKTESELLDDIATRGCMAVDYSRVKLNDAANIPMSKILELAIAEEMDQRIRRIRKLLAFYRPVPRMTLKRFTRFILDLISNIDPNMIDSLYRSSQCENSIRVDMDQAAFIEYFRREEDPVVPRNWGSGNICCNDFASYSTIYSLVLNRWTQFEPVVRRILKELRPDGPTRSLVAEIRHRVFQLLEAKVSFDGILFFQNYHRTLQTVMQACLKLNLPDPVTFAKQVTDFHLLLMKKLSLVSRSADGHK